MLSAILAGVGLGLNLWGQYSAKRAQERANAFNVAIDEQNARAAEASAQWAIARHRYDVKKLLGRQRARFAVSGFQLKGTPLLVMQETAAQAELDEIAMRYRGRLQAAGFRNQATMTRFEGKVRSKAAKIGMMGTLLTGGMKMGQDYFGWFGGKGAGSSVTPNAPKWETAGTGRLIIPEMGD